MDLCGLEGDTRKNEQGVPLDGYSVLPFLEERRELSNQHWTIRTRRWRYILYNNGVEALYDHDNDPVQFPLKYTRHTCNIGFFSRLRELNPESSYSVIG